MKKKLTIRLLAAGILFTLAAVLYSCGGGGYGGGSGGNTMAPGVFSVSSPADGAVGVGATPTLMWTPAVNATNYRVQVDTAGTFAGTLVINVLVGSTTYSYPVPPSTLSPGTMYFWRVIAENIYGQAVAGPRSFTP
jgi:mannan endo-1,4-beta-mannosidase